MDSPSLFPARRRVVRSAASRVWPDEDEFGDAYGHVWSRFKRRIEQRFRRKIKVWLALGEMRSRAADGNPVTYGHKSNANKTDSWNPTPPRSTPGVLLQQLELLSKVVLGHADRALEEARQVRQHAALAAALGQERQPGHIEYQWRCQ